MPVTFVVRILKGKTREGGMRAAARRVVVGNTLLNPLDFPPQLIFVLLVL